MSDVPHNRTYLVFERDIVTLCADCAAKKAPLAYQGVGATIRPCDECRRSPQQVEQEARDGV